MMYPILTKFLLNNTVDSTTLVPESAVFSYIREHFRENSQLANYDIEFGKIPELLFCLCELVNAKILGIIEEGHFASFCVLDRERLGTFNPEVSENVAPC